MPFFVLFEEFGDGAHLDTAVEDDFPFFVEDEHGGVAALVYVVGVKVIDVGLVAADINPRVIVLSHVLLPAVNIGIVGHGIDVEIAFPDVFQRIVQGAELFRLLLAGGAVGIVEPEDDVGFGQTVGGVPLAEIVGHGGVGDDQLLRLLSDEDGLKVFRTFLIFSHDVLI